MPIKDTLNSDLLLPILQMLPPSDHLAMHNLSKDIRRKAASFSHQAFKDTHAYIASELKIPSAADDVLVDIENQTLNKLQANSRLKRCRNFICGSFCLGTTLIIVGAIIGENVGIGLIMTGVIFEAPPVFCLMDYGKGNCNFSNIAKHAKEGLQSLRSIREWRLFKSFYRERQPLLTQEEKESPDDDLETNRNYSQLNPNNGI